MFSLIMLYIVVTLETVTIGYRIKCIRNINIKNIRVRVWITRPMWFGNPSRMPPGRIPLKVFRLRGRNFCREKGCLKYPAPVWTNPESGR